MFRVHKEGHGPAQGGPRAWGSDEIRDRKVLEEEACPGRGALALLFLWFFSLFWVQLDQLSPEPQSP